MRNDTPSTSRGQRTPIGIAYAATQVNATVFRVSSVTSAGPYQYAIYYDADHRPVVARRQPDSRDSATWERVALPVRGNVRDAHNGPVIGVSADGIVHVAYDHHANPLHYRRTARPHDLRSFGDEVPMTGRNERRVTYPQFVSAPDGTLYFFYRDGASGNGSLCLNRYDAAKKEWRAVHHPLVDGEGKCNPYWWRPSIGPDGALHVAWCWRDTGDARTNHDVCHMRSKDRGETWQSVEGKPVALPATRATAPVADPLPTGSNLINQCSSAVDDRGRPHLTHYHNDANGIPQYIHLWHDGKRWVRNVVSRRTARFTLGGGGTLKIPISRPEIAVAKNGTVCLVTRDAEAGGGVRLYRSRGRDYAAPWTATDITAPGEDLGEWEPTYDAERLRRKGILSLFVLPVRQGNHETVTDNAPQEAFLLEMPLT